MRAALESYPFQLKDVIAAMEKDRGARLQWIRADGGITHSRLSMQMIAGLLNTEVRIDKRHEASALGAAMLGFIGKGVLRFSDVEALIEKGPFNTYRPGQLDTGLVSAYDNWKKRL